LERYRWYNTNIWKNTDGKTTILDVITYILYGKTTTTLSPEKFGDARYINNKRKLDYV
jgi:hypothetical protein